MNNPTPGTRGRDGRDVLDGLEGIAPGPWRCHGVANFPEPIVVRPFGVTGDDVVKVCDVNRGRVDDQHNALAISRVPDLIAEVKALREALRGVIAEADRETVAFRRARALLPTPSGEGEG